MTTTIHTVGVCGAGGTMGAGIAIVAARAGFRTISFDVSEASLDRAAKQTAAFFNKSVERGKLKPAVHYVISKALFETYGTPGYAPARRSVVTAARQEIHR